MKISLKLICPVCKNISLIEVKKPDPLKASLINIKCSCGDTIMYRIKKHSKGFEISSKVVK
jgi:hypothetical protein